MISQRQISPALVTFYGYDGLGSVRFLTLTNGTITSTYVFDAYGTLLNSTGSVTNSFLFGGEYFDTHLNTYYLRVREYQPGTGRFLGSDPFEGTQSDPISLHKYLYCYASPVDVTDPSGYDGDLGSLLVVAAKMSTLAVNITLRAAWIAPRVTVVVFQATTGETLLVGAGTTMAAGAAISKVSGGIGTWTRAAKDLKGVVFGPYAYVQQMLRGSGWQANHLNQSGAYTKIANEVGAALDLVGSAFVRGTEHNQFHLVLERFWNQYRKGGRKFGHRVSNKEYLTALREALNAVNNGITGATKFTKKQIDALVELAEKEQIGYGYHDGPGGLRPEVPAKMNLK